MNIEHRDIKGIHKHLGYEHDEKGTKQFSIKESKMVERIKKIWDTRVVEMWYSRIIWHNQNSSANLDFLKALEIVLFLIVFESNIISYEYKNF